MICKWEKGDKKPSSRYQRLLRELFDRSSTELGFVEDDGYGPALYAGPGVGRMPAAPPATGGSPGGALPGSRAASPRPQPQRAAIMALPSALDGRPVGPGAMTSPRDTGPLERRMFLRMMATGGLGTTAGTGGGAGDAPWERLSAALTRPAPVDAGRVGELSLRTAGLYGLEERVPARALMPRVADHLGTVTRLLETAPPSVHRCRLTATAGETSALAGWLAYDLGDPAAARSYYRVAAQAAVDAGDDALSACVLGYESYLAGAEGRPDDACALLARARRHAMRGSSPVTRSWLAAREAEEQATRGDAHAAMNALDAAEDAFAASSPEAERVWTAFFDRARLDGMRVSTFVRLRQTTMARQAAYCALRSLGPSPTKKRAVVLADAAEAHAQQGDVEEACRLAADALAVVAQTDFSIGLDRLRRLSGRLDRWRALSPVRDLNDQIRAIAPV
jgi:hypothetical protein